MEVFQGTLKQLRAAARLALSCVLTLALLLLAALPALAGGVGLLAQWLAGLAWDLAARWAWGRLVAVAPVAEGLLPYLLELAPNTTATDEPLSLAYEVIATAGGAQEAGSAWVWACLALVAGRGIHRR